MKVWNATPEQIHSAADTAGVRLSTFRPDGRGFRFVLRTAATGQRMRWGRVSTSRTYTKSGKPRRVPGAVCWHGHRAFMRALFALSADARIQTGLADYRGSEDFEASHGRTFGQGNDNQLSYGSACDCEAMPNAIRGLDYGL